MISELTLYGLAVVLVVHVAFDLRNVWHAMHLLRARAEGPQICQRCYSPVEPPKHRAQALRELCWTVTAMVVLLIHLASDLLGDIP